MSPETPACDRRESMRASVFIVAVNPCGAMGALLGSDVGKIAAARTDCSWRDAQPKLDFPLAAPVFQLQMNGRSRLQSR